MATDVTWQEPADSGSVTTDDLHGITSDGSTWVAVGNNGTILTSGNGVSWSHATDSGLVADRLREVHFADSIFVAVGNNGTILTSSDGDTWSEPADSGSVTTETLLGVIHDGSGLWVAAGTNGTIISSPDGTTWTAESSGTTEHFYGIGFGDGLFVAAGANETIVTSTDGSTWSDESTNILSGAWYVGGVAFGGGAYLALVGDGRMTRSTDGSNWSEVNTGVSDRLTHGWYDARGNFMVVGNNGRVISSTDEGQSWATESTPTTAHLRCDHYGTPGPLWVAVGLGGVLLYGEYPTDPVGGRLLLDGLTLATSGGTVPDINLGDQWGQYAWGVDAWGTATDAPDPVYADAIVGRLSLRGTVLDLLNPEALPLSDDAVEYVHLNTGQGLTLTDDGVEYAHLNTGHGLVTTDDGVEYVHLNTTVNAEAVVGRLKLGGGTQEVFFVGYTVGSAVLTDSITASGQDAHLTWDETPTGTRLDFEVFRRSPSTKERFDPIADVNSYRDEVAADSPIAWWRCEETSGSTLSDETGNGHDGTPNGGLVLDFASAFNTLGSAVWGDGTDDWVDIPNNFLSTLLDGTNPFSIEMWLRSDGGNFPTSDPSSDEAPILFSAAAERSAFVTIGDNGSGTDYLMFRAQFSSSSWTSVVEYQIVDDTWYHLVITYSPTDGFVMYIDGAQVDSDPLTEGIESRSQDNALVGDPNAGTNRFFHGPMDEIAIYDAVLSAERVQAHNDAASNSQRIAQGIDVLEYTDVDPPVAEYDWQVFARVERD